MTSLPETPNPKEAFHTLNDAKPGDHSDDDSDANADGDGGRHDKGHDQDLNYTEEANTSYSLFSNPPDLKQFRQRLFDIKGDLELSATDFETYFPWVDNVWRKYRLEQRDNEPNTETFCCRLRPSNQNKAATPRPTVEGKQQRRKRKREDRTCPMLIKVTYIESPVKKVSITKTASPDITHSHDLDYMDQNKRNTAIMDVARREAIRGFLPGSIFWKMQEEPDKMDEAGGKFMKVSDVRNVQYPWRQQNPTVILKAHSGYTQQRTGPRQPRASAVGSGPSTPQNGEARLQKPVQTFVPHPPQPPPHPHPLPAPIATPASAPAPPPAPPPLPPGTLNYPEHAKEFLRPYVPYQHRMTNQSRPHVTLTWASSLDSRIALLPGLQTAISGPETKAMTHYLRSQHDAILIGVKTAISDDPGLNCRLVGAGGFGGPDRAMQPRPIIIDPRARLHIHPNMRLLRAASEGKALGPWVVVGPGAKLHPTAVTTLKAHGGEFLQINEIHPEHGLDWEALFSIFYREGINSIMVEGGGKVLSELLKARYTSCVDSIVVTIAPTFFGKSGVEVTPDTAYENQQPIQTRLTDIKWQPMGQSDMVLCAHLDKSRLQPRLPGIHEFSRQTGAAPPPPPPPVPPPVHEAQRGHAPHALPPQPPPPPPPPQHLQHSAQPPAHAPPPPPQTQQHPQQNGTSAPPSATKSPKFRHYGPPGPSR